MRILFRADASVEIGSGHIMRCATLAELLRAQTQEVEITFACCAAKGDMIVWLRQKGMTVIELPADDLTHINAIRHALESKHLYDWLVVDHYGLDVSWETQMRPYADKILVIDDLANRAHDCDMLLDQNDFLQDASRYQSLVPASCCILLGPEYALLRPEFAVGRAKALEKRTEPHSELLRLLIFFGGSDPTRETFKALEALDAIDLLNNPSLTVDVVVGASNPHRETIRRLCEQWVEQARPSRLQYHCQVENMAELMGLADLAIGAGGTATWERLCVGLPSVVIAVAENQRQISRQLADAGYHHFLGNSSDVSAQELARSIEALSSEVPVRKAMSEKGFSLVDGQGARRVMDILIAAH